MDGYGHSTSALRMPQLDVGTALHDNEPAEMLERADKL